MELAQREPAKFISAWSPAMLHGSQSADKSLLER